MAKVLSACLFGSIPRQTTACMWLAAGFWMFATRKGGAAPRLLATIRHRSAITKSDQSRAQQVDIYVSGHGGGANQEPLGLSTVLDQGGHGGGRIQDALSPSDQTRYYQAGPLPPSLVRILAGIAFQLTGQSLTGPVFPAAGP